VSIVEDIREDLALQGNIWKSYLYRFLMNFQLWWPIWVLYLIKDRDLSLTQITLLDTPFFLVIILSEVPTGAVADRFGRRVSLVFGSALFALAVFVFGIADNYLLILVSYTAWGLAQTFQSGADQAILYDSLKRIGREEEFQKINGRMWAVTSLAVLIAILIGAPIADATSFSLPILLSAGIALASVPVALLMHEPAHDPHEHREAYLEMVGNGIRDAWRQPALRYIIIFAALVSTATFTPMLFLQPFLDQHMVDTGDLGIWQAPVRGLGILSALAAFRVVATMGQRASFAAMPIALGGGMLVLASFDARWAYAAFLPMGIVAGMMNPVFATYVNRRIPSSRRATMLSVQSVVASIMLACIEPLGGLTADQLGLQGLFLVLAVATIVTAPIVFALWQRAEAAAVSGELPLSRSPEPVAVS
jgi:MFS family permease